jgi:hypothetical protein
MMTRPHENRVNGIRKGACLIVVRVVCRNEILQATRRRRAKKKDTNGEIVLVRRLRVIQNIGLPFARIPERDAGTSLSPTSSESIDATAAHPLAKVDRLKNDTTYS